MKLEPIVIHQNVKTGDFFISTDHCQLNTTEDFVPVTFYMPYHITARKGFEEGIIRTKTDMKRYLESNGDKEIANPNPIFQA